MIMFGLGVRGKKLFFEIGMSRRRAGHSNIPSLGNFLWSRHFSKRFPNGFQKKPNGKFLFIFQYLLEGKAGSIPAASTRLRFELGEKRSLPRRSSYAKAGNQFFSSLSKLRLGTPSGFAYAFEQGGTVSRRSP